MSVRVNKKVEQIYNAQTELPTPSSDDEDVAISDNDKELVTGKDYMNPFSLLEQSSDGEQKDIDDERCDNADQPSSSKANQSNKKNKKKRIKKQKSTEAAIVPAKKETVFMNKIKKNYRFELDENLMKIELKYLNPQIELRKKFTIKTDNNKRGHVKTMLKPTHMATYQELWPPLTKSLLSMKTDNPPLDAARNPEAQWFVFDHNEEYRDLQYKFYAAIAQAEPDPLVQLLGKSAYHVDSLIHLSELCKFTENFKLSAELIERALYILESSTHPAFCLTSGNCRLDYRRQENRGFFIVLFKHAQIMEKRACTRTAFELSKVLFTLEPETDPLAMILIIDYYAIRAQQYQWLVDFYKVHNKSRNLHQLPNMAYSYALALKLLNGEDNEETNESLQYALIMFPGLLRPLLEELALPMGEFSNNAYFTTAAQKQSPALEQLLCLYLCRASVIWRVSRDLGSWLEQNAKEVVLRLQKDKIGKLSSFYEKKRRTLYRVPPRPILRHIVLSDLKEKVPLAAFVANENEALKAHDPLPPLDAVNIYKCGGPANMSTDTGSTSVRAVSGNTLRMFIRSLMPLFNPNNHIAQPDVEQMVPYRHPRIGNRNRNDRPNEAEPQQAVQQQQEIQPQAQQQVVPQQRIDDSSGIEVIAEGNEMHQLDVLLQEAEERVATRRSRGNTGDSTTYEEITQSINEFVNAMRHVLDNQTDFEAVD